MGLIFGLGLACENQAPPTRGYCTGVVAFKVDKGRCGEVTIDEFGFIEGFTRYASNKAVPMLSKISEALNIPIVSEYEPEYWGFDTQEEWDAWLSNLGSAQELMRKNQKLFLRCPDRSETRQSRSSW
jgi:hypothetical protein